jgi:hypothetical protein
MCLAVARPGFAARWMDCRMEQGNLMPIRIRRHTIGGEGTQMVELGGITAIGSGVVTACGVHPV